MLDLILQRLSKSSGVELVSDGQKSVAMVNEKTWSGISNAVKGKVDNIINQQFAIDNVGSVLLYMGLANAKLSAAHISNMLSMKRPDIQKAVKAAL